MNLDSSLTLFEALKRASFFLSEHHHDEGTALTYWLYYKNWDLTDYVMNQQQCLSDQEAKEYTAVLERVIKHEPIQYIVGYAQFMDEIFKVSPDTLIPREDTQCVIEQAGHYLDHFPTANVLDIGTGTGVIAIQLKRQYPHINIVASDISAAALQITKENIKLHNVDIPLIESDVFSAIPSTCKFDLIVSNPPYISRREISVMDQSVIKYEPELALFAAEDGLAFYRQLAIEAVDYLSPTGRIVLEIGYRQGDAVKQIFQQALPHADIQINQDYNQLDRVCVIDLEKGIV